jgi:hypothetical protein
MKQVINLALVAIMSMSMTSCMSVNIGNGDVDKTPTQIQQIDQLTTMQPFDEVDIAGPFKVIYEQGNEHSVRVEASEQALKEMTIYVKDRELRIRKAVHKPTVSLKDVRVYVTSPVINMIELAGSGMFAASNPITVNNDLDVDLAGSGRVLLTAVTCHDSSLEIAGSGNIEIGNLTVDDVTTEIAGSGNINLGSMTSKKMNVEIAGSGDINCNNINADNVRVEIAGSGNVNLNGIVRNHTKDIAGSGKVTITSTSDNTIQ